jgi:hypothetical protein
VSERLGAVATDRQRRLGAVKCLHLRRLIEREDNRARGRVEVEPDDIDELLLEARVAGELERLAAPGLEAVITPQPAYRLAVDADARRQRARVVQCVEPSAGRYSSVTRTISATVPAGNQGLRPRPGATRAMPSTPSRSKRGRQRRTRFGETPSCLATRSVGTPSAANTSPRASITFRCGNLTERAIRSSAAR